MITKEELKKLFGNKKLKYNNISSKCLLKHWHQSRLEASVCNILLSMVQKKEIKGFISQKRYSLDVNGRHICDHIVDFLIVRVNDQVEVWDAKGLYTPVFRLKYKLFCALYPDIPYRVITKKRYMEIYKCLNCQR